MKSILHRYFEPLKRHLPEWGSQPLRAVVIALITPVRFSKRSGHWKSSIRRMAVDERGLPIPWYTYPAVDFLAQRYFKDKNVLEIGAGQSTLWWAEKARSVLSIEENLGWFEKLKTQVPSNVTLHHVPVDDRSMVRLSDLLGRASLKKFDVIIIDGHLRWEIAGIALDYLADDGALILDNSEGYGFYEVFGEKECRRIDFFGFAPGVAFRHCTSIVFVRDCFLLNPSVPISIIDPG